MPSGLQKLRMSPVDAGTRHKRSSQGLCARWVLAAAEGGSGSAAVWAVSSSNLVFVSCLLLLHWIASRSRATTRLARVLEM